MYTIWWFDRSTYCKVITTVRLVNTVITWVTILCVHGEKVKICLLKPRVHVVILQPYEEDVVTPITNKETEERFKVCPRSWKWQTSYWKPGLSESKTYILSSTLCWTWSKLSTLKTQDWDVSTHVCPKDSQFKSLKNFYNQRISLVKIYSRGALNAEALCREHWRWSSISVGQFRQPLNPREKLLPFRASVVKQQPTDYNEGH